MNLKITNLTKTYRKGKCAIDDLSLELKNGMFGLLGPNGAGKTTLMKMLSTLLEPTSGAIHYDGLKLGKDNQEIRCLFHFISSFSEEEIKQSINARH